MASDFRADEFLDALVEGRQDLAVRVIQAGIDPNQVFASGDTPLTASALLGREEVMSALLHAGARVNDRTGSLGETALTLAASAGQIGAVLLLLRDGATVGIANGVGRTPLHIACMFGYPDVVAALLNNGADVDKIDIQGATPLITAVSGTFFLPESALMSVRENNPNAVVDQAAVVSLLIQHGADLSAKAPNGIDALGIAVRLGDSKLVELLKGSGTEVAKKSGCYVATYVYGTYDCPELWVLRRWRDERLAESAQGRACDC